ncbi:hypothetical protein [Streptomyces nigrescens]
MDGGDQRSHALHPSYQDWRSRLSGLELGADGLQSRCEEARLGWGDLIAKLYGVRLTEQVVGKYLRHHHRPAADGMEAAG